jgi:signal transduction histidine kinase
MIFVFSDQIAIPDLLNAGKIISKTMIMEHVWEHNFDPQTNVVETRMCRLSDKIDRDFGKTMIKTVRGVGYAINMAHDLRSPITRIRGIAEMTITSAKDDQDYELMAGSIVEECDRLLGIINTMLDISEAKAGLSKLNISQVDISKIVNETCELFRPIAEDKNTRIIKRLVDNTFIWADNQKLQRVVSNLLDNALKYTPAGGTITVTVEGNADQVVVTVNDNGIGISRDDLPYIFRRFYRCDRSRSQPGTGLGLSWARAIIEAHGGHISATSTLNERSTFTVTLPNTPVPV